MVSGAHMRVRCMVERICNLVPNLELMFGSRSVFHADFGR